MKEYCGRPTRIAVLTQISAVNEPDHLIWVFDPDDLLRPHRDELRSYFGDDHTWKPTNDTVYFGQDHSLSAPSLDGVIGIVRRVLHAALEGTTVAVFVESAPGVKTGPIADWLESTSAILAGEIVYRNERRGDPFRVRSDQRVRLFARDAISQYVAKRCSFDSDKWRNLSIVNEVFDAVLRICKTTEEQKLPSGQLLITSLEQCSDLNLIVEFDEQQPRMHQAKRVGKLLQAVPESSHWLVCNTDLEELNLVGMVAHDGRLSNSIGIRFRKGDA